MPDSCCAVCCSNRRSKGSGLKFYRIRFGSDDQSLALRKEWVTTIKWDKWTKKQIENARIYSTQAGTVLFLCWVYLDVSFMHFF